MPHRSIRGPHTKDVVFRSSSILATTRPRTTTSTRTIRLFPGLPVIVVVFVVDFLATTRPEGDDKHEDDQVTHQSCPDHGARGRVRIHDKVSRRAKNRLHQQRQDRRIKSPLPVETNKFRIRDGRGQRHRRDRSAGHRIVLQPFPPISPQILQPGVIRRTRGTFLRVMDDYSVHPRSNVGSAIFVHRCLILFRYEPTVRNRGNVIVGVFFGSLGQLHLFP
jgi:hypothetical protein